MGLTTFRIDGIDNVINKINEKMKTIEGNISTKGFIRVAIAIRQSMEKNTPYIPRDTGNLRASWFTAIKSNTSTKMEGIGYNAGIKGVQQKDKQTQAAVVANSRAVVMASNKPLMVFGFAANYAAPVHEMTGVNWKVPGSGPYFFQRALEREKENIITILANNAKK